MPETHPHQPAWPPYSTGGRGRTPGCPAIAHLAAAHAGPGARIRRRFGSTADLKKGKDGKDDGKEAAEKDAELVKRVMETSGGDNEALARKIHERYDKCAPTPPRHAACIPPSPTCSHLELPARAPVRIGRASP